VSKGARGINDGIEPWQFIAECFRASWADLCPAYSWASPVL
jgi:hypothetical protein